MNQRTGKAVMFHTNQDRAFFSSQLSVLEARFGLEIHAYVLMGNHYHVLARSRDGRLSEAMQWMGMHYARYFNHTHSRVGAFFRARFNSCLVEDEQYRAWLGVYIHLNPFKGGLGLDPVDWPWSSLPQYVGRSRSERWLHQTVLLGGGSQQAYANLVMSHADGGGPYKAADPAAVEGAWRSDRDGELSIERVEELVTTHFGMPESALQAQRADNLSVARSAVLVIASARTSLTQRELAARYGLASPSSVGAAVRRFDAAMSADAPLARWVASAKEP
jgi:putative transposase